MIHGLIFKASSRNWVPSCWGMPAKFSWPWQLWLYHKKRVRVLDGTFWMHLHWDFLMSTKLSRQTIWQLWTILNGTDHLISQCKQVHKCKQVGQKQQVHTAYPILFLFLFSETSCHILIWSCESPVKLVLVKMTKQHLIEAHMMAEANPIPRKFFS